MCALAVTPENSPTSNSKQAANSSLPSSGTETVASEALALACATETNALKAVTEAAKPSDGKPAQRAGAPPSPTAEAQQAAAPAETKPAVKSSLFGSNTQPNRRDTRGRRCGCRCGAARQNFLVWQFNKDAACPRSPPSHQETQQSTDAADKDGAKPTNAKAGDTAETNTEQAATPERKLPSGRDNGVLVRLFANNQAKSPVSRQVAVIQPKSQPQLRAVETPVQTASALPSANHLLEKRNICHRCLACGPMPASRSCSATVFMPMMTSKQLAHH